MACNSVFYLAGSETDVGGVFYFRRINNRFCPALVVFDRACASTITGRGFLLRVVILQDSVVVVGDY